MDSITDSKIIFITKNKLFNYTNEDFINKDKIIFDDIYEYYDYNDTLNKLAEIVKKSNINTIQIQGIIYCCMKHEYKNITVEKLLNRLTQFLNIFLSNKIKDINIKNIYLLTWESIYVNWHNSDKDEKSYDYHNIIYNYDNIENNINNYLIDYKKQLDIPILNLYINNKHYEI